jgi:hypothetical protein
VLKIKGLKFDHIGSNPNFDYFKYQQRFSLMPQIDAHRPLTDDNIDTSSQAYHQNSVLPPRLKIAHLPAFLLTATAKPDLKRNAR